jgi:hypothetical protein
VRSLQHPRSASSLIRYCLRIAPALQVSYKFEDLALDLSAYIKASMQDDPKAASSRRAQQCTCSRAGVPRASPSAMAFPGPLPRTRMNCDQRCLLLPRDARSPQLLPSMTQMHAALLLHLSTQMRVHCCTTTQMHAVLLLHHNADKRGFIAASARCATPRAQR